LRPEDFSMVGEWLSQPSINRWLTAEWRDRTVDAMLLGVATRNKRNKLFLVSEGATPVGLVAIADWDAVDKTAMIWYLRGADSESRAGVMTDAVGLLVRHAFDVLEIESLHAWILQNNERSRRVLERSGFREMGVMRNAAQFDGQRVDRVYFDLPRVPR
jgi:RimJ/RimL family protein N-acetyltransferase